jgi:hypothetical protein
MPQTDTFLLWTLELHIAKLQERIKSLETVSGAGAATARMLIWLRERLAGEIRHRDELIARLIGADYLHTRQTASPQGSVATPRT